MEKRAWLLLSVFLSVPLSAQVRQISSLPFNPNISNTYGLTVAGDRLFVDQV